ncbi:hypothetical protein HYH03_001724 [Edaphochlamys debaryana]|uniref:MYND-type domain-containing protein n=1 Tax=Edaphochlamys debaryana TaxID=47281 RepID=A0A836C5X1_9CHLO|nr:hypothetical protein HYH03_001724 [Edaphochlamys debaryana]|eukprot:KAG2500142.1 hypothetical protein HYH03_001724 [Edaphochlamys debaryana]
MAGKVVIPKSILITPLVERFTAARCCWMDPVSLQPLSDAEAASKMRRAKRAGRGAAAMEPFPGVSSTGSVPDRTVYDSMTAGELVVTLFAVRCIHLCSGAQRDFALGINLAQVLFTGASRRARVQQVLLPALAAMDVGEPHHMTAPQWETVWLETLAPYFLNTVRKEPGSALAKQALQSLVDMAHRLPSLDPDRAMSYKITVTVAAEVEEDDALLRFASTMAQLGEAQSHDYAFALATWMRVHTLLYGNPSARQRLTAGELRAAVAKVHEARKRLKKVHLWGSVQQAVRSQVAEVLRALDEVADLPDTAVLQLPYKGRAEGPAASNITQAAAAAAGTDPEPPCDGCHLRFLHYLRCGGCRQRRYCSRACQVADWRGGHKEACKQMAEEAAAAARAAAEAEAGAAGAEAGQERVERA